MASRVRACVGQACLGVVVALAAATFTMVDVAQASLPLDLYRSENFRIGRLHFVDFPLTRRPPVPARLASIVVPPAWIDGATPSLEADRFVRQSRDSDGLIVGRSAYEAPPAGCPTSSGTRGHDATSLVFDPSPERCAGFPAGPSDLSAR